MAPFPNKGACAVLGQPGSGSARRLSRPPRRPGGLGHLSSRSAGRLTGPTAAARRGGWPSLDCWSDCVGWLVGAARPSAAFRVEPAMPPWPSAASGGCSVSWGAGRTPRTPGPRRWGCAWFPHRAARGPPCPPHGAAATHTRLSKAAPAECPRGPSQEPPRAHRERLGAGGWTGTQVFLGFTWWPGRFHSSRLLAGAACASRPAQFSSALMRVLLLWRG